MNFFAGAYFDSSSKKRKILLFFLDNLQSSVTLINDESMSHCAGDVMIHKQSLKTKVKEYILEVNGKCHWQFAGWNILYLSFEHTGSTTE